MSRIALCADSESLRHPALIGLDDVSFEALPWVRVLSGAREARAYVQASPSVQEAWVVSSDDMAAINLAAALKRDRAALAVFLVLFESTGSALSRAKSAGLNGALSKKEFVERFALENRKGLNAPGEDGEVDFEGFWGDDELCDVLGPEGAAAAKLAHHFGATAAPVVATASASAAAPALGAPVAVSPSFAPEKKAPVPLSLPLSEQGCRASAVAAGSSAFVISVVSGSGGAGKSAVAAVLAAAAKRRGLCVLALDCDLQFGDLHELLGVKDPATVEDALRDPSVLDAPRGPQGSLSLLAAPSRLERAEIVAPSLGLLIDEALPRFDVVVVNTGSSWTEGHAVLIERSACTLFLVDQRASSVRACVHALDLCARCGIATGSFLYAVNRCARGALFTSVDVSCALKGAHVVELKDGGGVVEELLGAGMVDELLAARNDFCESVDKVLDEVLPLSEVPGKLEGSPGGGSRRTLFEGVLFSGAERKTRRRGKGRGIAGLEIAEAASLALGVGRPLLGGGRGIA